MIGTYLYTLFKNSNATIQISSAQTSTHSLSNEVSDLTNTDYNITPVLTKNRSRNKINLPILRIKVLK